MFGTVEVQQAGELYEYAVLVTSLSEGMLGVAQLYRDGAEAENVLDELKNRWGWAGFTTPDHQRCQIMARIIALIYNSWSLYAGLAILSRHTEAATSRPLMLHGIARRTSHNNRTTLTLTMTSNHAQAGAVRKALEAVSQLLQRVAQTAEQLTVSARWRQLLRFIFRDWLKTRAPDPPWLLSMGLTDSRI